MKRVLVIACLLLLPQGFTGPEPAAAQDKRCKFSVVGGKQKGRTIKLKMRGGKFVGKGIKDSTESGCAAMINVYGRWYHFCNGGRVVVHRWVESTKSWKQLSEKNLRKYRHDCI